MFTLLHLDGSVFNPGSNGPSWDDTVRRAEAYAFAQLGFSPGACSTALLRLPIAARFNLACGSSRADDPGAFTAFLRHRHAYMMSRVRSACPRQIAALRAIFPKTPAHVVEGRYIPPAQDAVAIAAIITRQAREAVLLTLQRAEVPALEHCADPKAREAIMGDSLEHKIPARLVIAADDFKAPPTLDALIAQALALHGGQAARTTLVSDDARGIEAGSRAGIGALRHYAPRGLGLAATGTPACALRLSSLKGFILA